MKISQLVSTVSAVGWQTVRVLATLPTVFFLVMPACGPQVLAQSVAPAPTASPAQEATASGLATLENLRAKYASSSVSFKKPTEFLRSDDARVKPHGGRISLKSLDLTRPPSEEELRQSGQLGSRLTPSRAADPVGKVGSAERKRQEADNLAFGRAMQKWNEHHYGEAEQLFNEHLSEFPDSPWSGEADLHLGCKAQFSGVWEEAKMHFEAILAREKVGTDIWQKAKLRRAVLHLDQGELEESANTFAELLKTEKNWERITYSQRWMHQISLLKTNEVALRDCGAEGIAVVLEARGMKEQAKKAHAAPAPEARGFSLGELVSFADNLGLHSVAARGGFDGIEHYPLPFIAHYSDRHFVVVTGLESDGSLKLYDPRLKHETKLSRRQFAAQWSGLAVFFDPLPKGAVIASQTELSNNYGGCCGLPKPPPCGGPDDCESCKSGAPGVSGGGGASGGSPKCSSCGRALPVWQINPLQLNLVVQDTPLWYDATVGPAINMRLVFNSEDSLNAYRPFGNKWAFDYASYAMESPSAGGDGSMVVLMPGGRMDTYAPDGNGGYVSADGGHYKLTKTAPYAFTLEMTGGTKFFYGIPAGMNGNTSLLLSIQDPSGKTVTIEHDGAGQITKVKDALAHEFNFTYNTAGLVSMISDPWGRQCTFAYDASNNLVGQTDMGGISYSYTYDSNMRMASLTAPAGTTSFYFESGSHNVDNMSLGYPDYRYPPAGGVMWDNVRLTITHPDGKKEELYYCAYSSHTFYWHRDRAQYAIAGSTAAALTGPMTKYDYTTINNRAVLTTTTFADGITSTRSNFLYNQPEPQTVTDENGHVTTYTYNNLGHVLTKTDARNHTTTYEYAASGAGQDVDLLKTTNHLGKVTRETTYDSSRRISSSKDALGRKIEYTYNASGQTAAVTRKDAAGNVVQTKTMNYNGLNQLESITQGGQTLQSYVYDSVGRVQMATDRNGYTLSYTYDNLNRIVRTTFMDGSFTENKWGCCMVEQVQDRMGLYTHYVYDQLKHLVYQFDPAGRGTSYGYDAVGNMTWLQDGNGSSTYWSYDARNRMVRKTYADGSSYRYTYDGVGNLQTRVDAKGVATTYGYDDTNNLTSIAAPGMAAIGFGYDEVDRRATMSDGVGNTVFGYDDAGQLTSIDGPWANDTITLGYDAMGRETNRQINGAANSGSISYDAFDRIGERDESARGLYHGIYRNGGDASGECELSQWSERELYLLWLWR